MQDRVFSSSASILIMELCWRHGSVRSSVLATGAGGRARAAARARGARLCARAYGLVLTRNVLILRECFRSLFFCLPRECVSSVHNRPCRPFSSSLGSNVASRSSPPVQLELHDDDGRQPTRAKGTRPPSKARKERGHHRKQAACPGPPCGRRLHLAPCSCSRTQFAHRRLVEHEHRVNVTSQSPG